MKKGLGQSPSPFFLDRFGPRASAGPEAGPALRTIPDCRVASAPDPVPAQLRFPHTDPFWRCLLLAVLVHVWVALTIGTRPGPSQPGSGGWGDLAITLQGVGTAGPSASPDGAAEPTDAAWRDDGPLGEATRSRHGGRVRAAPAPDDSGPGAQRQGRWQAQEVPEAPDRGDDVLTGPQGSDEAEPRPDERSKALPERTLPEVAAPRPAVDRAPALPALTPSAVAELAPVSDTVSVPDPLLRTLVDAPAPQASTRADPRLQAPSVTVRASPLGPTTAQVELPTPEPVLRALDLPQPVRTVQRGHAAVAAPRPSVTAQDLAPVQARVDVPPDAPVLKSLDVRLPTPTARTRPRVDALMPATSAHSDLAPVTAQVEVPEPAPVWKTLGDGAIAPPRLSRDTREREPLSPPKPQATTSDLRPLDPLAPVALPPTTSTTAGTTSATTAPAKPDTQARTARGDAVPEPALGARLSTGSPDASARVGHDVATAPSASASAPPRPLNLALPRANGPTARQGPGLLALLPAVPETKSKLEKGIEDAQREDCRKAHADKGVLGAIPLALDSARGKGCKW